MPKLAGRRMLVMTALVIVALLEPPKGPTVSAAWEGCLCSYEGYSWGYGDEGWAEHFWDGYIDGPETFTQQGCINYCEEQALDAGRDACSPSLYNGVGYVDILWAWQWGGTQGSHQQNYDCDAIGPP